MTDSYDKDENKQISNCLKLKDKFCNTRESFGNFIDINVLIFRIGLFLKFVMLSSTDYVNIMTNGTIITDNDKKKRKSYCDISKCYYYF